MKTTEFIKQHQPCAEGRNFAMQFETMAEVWDRCERLDWLIYMAERALPVPSNALQRFALFCAAQVEHLLLDQRSRDAIQITRRYLNGEASDGELRAAARAANAAANAAIDDARAAADAAYAAYAAIAASDATAASKKAQVRKLKELIPNPFN